LYQDKFEPVQLVSSIFTVLSLEVANGAQLIKGYHLIYFILHIKNHMLPRNRILFSYSPIHSSFGIFL
jgi:hypothetical protein